MRDPTAAEPQPAVAKYRDTARQAAAKTERPRPPHAAEGSPQARALFFAHGPEVLAALTEPDARTRGKQLQLRNDMTSH